MLIDSVKRLHESILEPGKLDSLTLDLDQIWPQVSLDYLVFFAVLKCKSGVVAKLKCTKIKEGFENDSSIRAWKIAYILNKYFSKHAKVHSKVSGTFINIEIISEIRSPNSYDIVLVSSGKIEEALDLKNAIKSAFIAKNNTKLMTRIYVCGPTGELSSLLQKEFPSLEWIQFESSSFTEKKQFILNTSTQEGLVMLHTRINLDADFLKNLEEANFSLSSPEVSAFFGRKKDRYLDFCCIDSYRIGGKSRKTKALWWITKDNYMCIASRYSPYIDGGATIFNFNAIENRNLFNTKLEWGQAEDVDMAETAYNMGYYPTYHSSSRCLSTTNKLSSKHIILKRILIPFMSKSIYKNV